MKNTTCIARSLLGASFSPLRSRAWAFLLSAAAIVTLLFSTASSAFAGSATWLASPPTGNWNHAANWTPATIPNGPSDTAAFASSNKTAISLSANTEVNGIVFNAGASAFTITASRMLQLLISGVGITNNSGITQNFVTGDNETNGSISFTNSATAGSLTAFTNNANSFGTTQFLDTSTAGNGTFTNNGGVNLGGVTVFFATSTAGNGTFINNGGIAIGGGGGGATGFTDTSTAGNGTFINNGGMASNAGGGSTALGGTSTGGNGPFINNGSTVSGGFGGSTGFTDGATAGNATLIANGGTSVDSSGVIQFAFDCTGGTARVEVFGNGHLDISNHSAPGVTTGSIEGSGLVFLGANNLTVGTNNLSTTFFGVIQEDGGQISGTGGSLTKTGKGKLTLSKASGNSYTGTTTINKGTLIAKNKTGSATGTGAVQVVSGTLSGTGKISGAVTVGNGTTAGAILQGGVGTKAGTLTVNNTLTFNTPATYKCVLNRVTTPKAGNVNAAGVTINANVPFTFIETGTAALTAGTVFTVINNTSANPIFGTFSNLPDGSTFTSGGTTFKANYEGGTGNDLTLTVQ